MGLSAHADPLVKIDFEAMPPYLPNWAGSYHNAYQTATAWKTPFTITLDESSPHSGVACLLMQVTQEGAGDKTVSLPEVGVPAPGAGGNRIRVRFFARTERVQEGELEARLLEHNGAGKVLHWAGGQKTLKVVPQCDDWTEVEQEAPLDPETRRVLLIFVLKSGNATATVRLDDLSLELVPASPVLPGTPR